MEAYAQRAGVILSVRFMAATLLAVFMLFGLPLVVAAVDREVVINELMWDETEYVELYNPGDVDVGLEGWELTRQQADKEVETIIKFSEGDTIVARDYFLIDGSMTLVNTGELVTLTNASGVVIDQANQLGPWYAGENTTDGVSMERNDAGSDGTIAGSWHSSTGLVSGRSGTPGEVNSSPKINIAPEAAISGATNGLVNQELNWTAEDSSDVDSDSLTYSWTFGDGSTGAGIEGSHIYTAAGTYTVTVTVADNELENEASMQVVVTAPVYSDAVVVNEWLPNPVGSDTEGEFIEIKNMGSESVDLSDWQLDDKQGGSAAFTISSGTTLAAGEIKSFNRSDTKIALNNGGDTVRLLDPSGDVKFSYTYSTTVPEGQSYNRKDDGSYALSTTTTPGSVNIFTELVDEEEELDDPPSPEASSSAKVTEDESEGEGEVLGESIISVVLKNIREEEIGTMIETQGVVSAPPGVLGDKILYLAGSGVQVYFHKEEYPDLKLGDTVKIRGELTTSLGEYRVKLAQATDVTKVNVESAVPTPHQLKTGEVGENVEGWLVIIEGEVASTSGNTFYVDDGSGEIKIYIKESTEIDKPKMRKGMAVTITGVVSRTNTGYRILPRWQDDVRMGRVAGLTSFPAAGLRQGSPLRQGYGGRAGLQAGLVIILVGYLLVSARVAKEPIMVDWTVS